jgi:flagellar protein FlaG
MAIQQVTAAGAGATVSPARAAASDPAPAHAPLPEARPVRLTAAQVEQMVQEVRQVVAPVAQNLRFSIDEGSGRTVVKVVDAQTEEVLRQIPSEEWLSISKALDKLQGLLVSNEA